MPCHITDGPQTPEDVPVYVEEDEDEAYERHRQQEIDDEAFERERRLLEEAEAGVQGRTAPVGRSVFPLTDAKKETTGDDT